jgi:hypothetical protein
MGLHPEVGDFTISQYGESSKATIKVDNAVGFLKQEDGNYAMVGDFYHATKDNLRDFYGNNNFAEKLTGAYAFEHAKQQLDDMNMGWTIEENAEGVVGKDGMIRFIAVSYT